MFVKLADLPDVFVMKKNSIKSRSKRQATNLTSQLSEDPSVFWAEQQIISVREKREFISPEEMGKPRESSVKRGNKVSTFFRNLLDDTKQFALGFDSSKRNVRYRYNDELWPYQWYIHNPGLSKWDHGITRAWEMGYTGSGVVVTVLDDGKLDLKRFISFSF